MKNTSEKLWNNTTLLNPTIFYHCFVNAKVGRLLYTAKQVYMPTTHTTPLTNRHWLSYTWCIYCTLPCTLHHPTKWPHRICHMHLSQLQYLSVRLLLLKLKNTRSTFNLWPNILNYIIMVFLPQAPPMFITCTYCTFEKQSLTSTGFTIHRQTDLITLTVSSGSHYYWCTHWLHPGGIFFNKATLTKSLTLYRCWYLLLSY